MRRLLLPAILLAAVAVTWLLIDQENRIRTKQDLIKQLEETILSASDLIGDMTAEKTDVIIQDLASHPNDHNRELSFVIQSALDSFGDFHKSLIKPNSYPDEDFLYYADHTVNTSLFLIDDYLRNKADQFGMTSEELDHRMTYLHSFAERIVALTSDSIQAVSEAQLALEMDMFKYRLIWETHLFGSLPCRIIEFEAPVLCITPFDQKHWYVDVGQVTFNSCELGQKTAFRNLIAEEFATPTDSTAYSYLISRNQPLHNIDALVSWTNPLTGLLSTSTTRNGYFVWLPYTEPESPTLD